MNMFKNFEDFKSRADNEYINDLFYFFKGHVQDKEWHPQTEVTFYGLNGEFDEGINFTLGEARDFLSDNYSRVKTEEVANSFSERVKNVEAWSPEKSGPVPWTPPVERESIPTSDDDFDPEIDRDVLDDEEYEEIFDNKEEDEEIDEEESLEEFLEDLLDDDEDSDGEEALTAKDKIKKKKKKVKVLGEELPFEDDNRQQEMAIEKAKVEDIKARQEALRNGQGEFEEELQVNEMSAGKSKEKDIEGIEDNLWPNQDFGVDENSFNSNFNEDEITHIVGSFSDNNVEIDASIQTGKQSNVEKEPVFTEKEILTLEKQGLFDKTYQENPQPADADIATNIEQETYVSEHVGESNEIPIGYKSQYNDTHLDEESLKIKMAHEAVEQAETGENFEHKEPSLAKGDVSQQKEEPYRGSEESISNNDELLEIDFSEDWNNSEEAKLAKLAKDQEESSINPILGIAAGISKVLNGKDYEYQGEDAKLFGQHETEEVNHQKEAATEAAIIELARKRAEQNVQVELIEEDTFEQSKTSHEYNEMSRSHKTMEEALNETINKMGEDLDDINQYNEYGQVIHPEVVIDKMLSEDENAGNAFKGQGSAGDMSAFGQAFKDFASRMGNDDNHGYGNGNNVADILNGLVMGMAFTGSGDQIRETAPEPVVPPPVSSTEHIRGVHESADGRNLGVESGFNLDDYGNLKTAAQERYEAEKRDNYEIGQDTRDIQKFVDAAVADKDARDALMVQSYGQEMVTMPASTMMQGEDFNRVYMEHFADVTAVEFSATPIPENAQTIDFSVAGNGAVLGYEENGVLYITAAPPAGSDLSLVTEPQVYLNPDSAGMFKDATHLQSVSFGDNIADTSFVHNMGGMFINCENLIEVNADYLNTERLQNIDGLFANCSNLETFNNEGWKTSNVVTASFAFSECHALIQDPSANWHMENLRYADGFMSGCTNLTNIDMSDWNARNLLITREMFNGCSSAEYININGLDTINVKDMAGMFKCCENLEDVNLLKLNTSSLSPVVEGKGGVEVGYQGNLGHPIDDIFYGCTKLAESGEFKSQAMAWEASANRAVELNSPVYMEPKTRPSSYEQLGVPIVTEVQNRDGSVSRMTSYYNQDGSTTFVIPSATSQFSYERMVEAQPQYNESPVMVMSKPNNDGTTSVITSKTYADNSRVVQTEVVGVDGQVIHGNVVSYDKFGTEINNIPLTKIDELAKNNPLFVSSKVNEDGSISVMTSKTYADNSKIVKTETYGKDGVVMKESVVSFDGNGVKMAEIPTSKVEDLAVASAAVVLATVNRDGTSSIVTSKTYADNSHIVRTEMIGRDGNVARENVVSYDKNGVQMFSVPTDKMQDIQQDVLKLSSLKVNGDGSVSVVTTKTFGDSSKIVNTEVFGQQGAIKNEFAAYDKNGVKLENISSSKLEELVRLNPENIVLKSNENGTNSIVATKAYEDGSKIVRTEIIGRDGNSSKGEFTAYDKNGTQISNIPESKLEELAKMSAVGVVLASSADGSASVATTKAFSDNSKVVKTEEFSKNGVLVKDNITAYDKNGTQISNIPESKLEELAKMSAVGIVLASGVDGSASIITTKVFSDNSKVVKTEEFSKNGVLVKDNIAGYDKNSVQTENIPSTKLEELMKVNTDRVSLKVEKNGDSSILTTKVFDNNARIEKVEAFEKGSVISKDSIVIYDKDGVQLSNIPTTKLEELMKSNASTVEVKKNDDGTISIVSSKLNTDNSKTVKTEILEKDGNVLRDNVVAFDKNGTKIAEMPVNKFEDALKAGSVSVTAKVNKDGVTSIITEKAYADKTRVVQTETVHKDGTVVKDVVAYDKTGKQLSNVSHDKLVELASVKKLEVTVKSDGHQIIMTVPKADGIKTTTTINVDKNGKHITSTTVHGKDGNSKLVNSPIFTREQKEQSVKSLSGIEDKTKKRRESKGKEGHAFGNSKSSNERKIYDAAKLKKDQDLYKTGKVAEEIGRGAKPVFGAAWSAIKGLAENPQDESLTAEAKKELSKYKNVAKTVVGGVFGVSIAASLQAEKTDFNKIMKAAQTTKGSGLESKLAEKGLTLESLQKKSQKEVVQTLSGLKDSHGKRLLSDKEIRNIAKYRNGAIEMVTFEKTIVNARDAGLFEKVSKNNKGLTSAQEKALEKFNTGRLDKLKAKDIANLADAYFERASSSPLYGIKVSKLSKKELDDIISGKNPYINFKKLSDTEKSLLKATRRTSSIKQKARDIKNNQALKRLNPFSFRQSMEILKKTGSGLAQETSHLLSDTYRKAGLVYTGATTAISVSGIYGGLALKGVKFGGKLFSKTPPGKIVIKAGGKVVSAIGNSFVGKSVKAVGEGFKEVGDAAKALKKTYKDTKKKAKEKAKEKITAGAKKAADKAQRTAAGKIAAKAAGKARMIAESKTAKGVGKVVGTMGKIISAPFKGLAWIGGKTHAIVNVIKGAVSKLMLYLAAGLAGIILIMMLLIMIISAVAGGGSTAMNISTAIMAPPSVDINDNPLRLSDAEYQTRWDNFKLLIQEKYQDTKDEQTNIIDSVDDIFGEVPNINGSPIIGWAGDQIMEYGVSTDIAVNDGYWIAYEPVADDNAKDAIAIAYVIMGSKDFYYEEAARNKLIEDLIPLLNPEIQDGEITNTIYPGATYADDNKKIYACLTGCETLTYYCADNSAYSSFSKSGCVSKSKNYTGTKAVKDLEDCVRLSIDGTTIVANETQIPNAAEPVIYADNLESHTYGDSYISTCTGNEKVEFKYKYKYEAPDMVSATAYEYQSYHGYYTRKYFPSSDCSRECPWALGAHYHFYDRYGNLVDYQGENDMEIPGTVIKTSQWKYDSVKISELGCTHGIHTEDNGIDDASQVIGPTGTLPNLDNKVETYIRNYLLNYDEIFYTAEITEDPGSQCSSWKVKFECSGHPINTCPNGHTDLGVTISQYSAEDFKCFGGTKLDLPSHSSYSSYINEFMSLDQEVRDASLAMIKSIIENDWYALYGVSDQKTMSIAENSQISEAFIYNYLISDASETSNGLGMGMSKANAAAFLGYMKVGSNFKINAESGGYYGLCLWADEQLERVGRGSSDNQATLLEQLTLLKTEYSDTSLNSGFKTANDLVEFRGCEDTIDGAQEAAKILVEKWECGNVDNVSAVQAAAVQYFNRMSGADREFSNPCMQTINNYVTWALKTASSPEHGYCQGKFQNGSVGDFNCGTFVDNSVREGTRGTDDEVAGWPDGRFQVLSFSSGATEADLQFGDLIYDPMEAGDTSDHIEIYIGNGCSVGARGADGNFGCSQNDERWTKHPSSWTDHVFHKAGDQGIRWKNGGYTYNEIAASTVDLSKYKTVYRLKP